MTDFASAVIGTVGTPIERLGPEIVINVNTSAVVGVGPTVENPQIKIVVPKMIVDHVENDGDALGMCCFDELE